MVAQTSIDLDATYDRLPEEVRDKFDALLRAKRFQELDDFIVEVSPHLPPPPHVSLLTSKIEEAMRHRIKLCISWPPRHAKTTTMLHGFAWWLRNVPADTCAYFSYSDRQGRSKSRLARRLAEGAGVVMDKASNDMSEWRTVQGGGLLAGGAGGGLTGQGVSGLMVVDDPYKNRADADSPVIRERIWEWFNEVVITRLEGASVIVVHTRWHEDDLIGRLADDPAWAVINLPATAEEDDPLGRVPGQALWPARFPDSELASIRSQIGEWSYAALYQGHPRPRGANVFGEPTYYDPATFDPTGCQVILGVDPAATEKTTADYSVIVALAVRGHGPEARAYVLDVVRRQVTVPTLVQLIRSAGARWWNAPAAIESVGGFKAVPQMLRQVDPTLRIMELPARGDKFQRAQPVASAWNEGRVLVPTTAAWLKPFVDEISVFTGVKDAHDDQVDALSHAWNSIAYQPRVVRGVRRQPTRWR